jgi:hypothetical protein
MRQARNDRHLPAQAVPTTANYARRELVEALLLRHDGAQSIRLLKMTQSTAKLEPSTSQSRGCPQSCPLDSSPGYATSPELDR